MNKYLYVLQEWPDPPNDVGKFVLVSEDELPKFKRALAASEDELVLRVQVYEDTLVFRDQYEFTTVAEYLQASLDSEVE